MFNLINKNETNIKTELLSGLTVALALVPEAIAFAFIVGIQPLYGLYAAFVIGLFTSVFGGRPGMISGATGAMAIVLVALVKQGDTMAKSATSNLPNGVELMFAAVVLAGVILVLIGLFRLGKFIRLVPHSVMLGFVNGLAVVIFLAQMGDFHVQENGVPTDVWLSGTPLYILSGLVLVTMAIMYALPKITKAFPSGLAGIIVVTLIAMGLYEYGGFETARVGEIQGAFPPFHSPDILFSLETLKFILPYSFILAGVAAVESLLTLSLIDEITETRGSANRECIALGAGNIASGFFSGMGGCAMIGQSMININSGGRSRLSGLSAALFLLLFIMVGSPVIAVIPKAALVGVMFMVVIGTFEWSSLRTLGKVPTSDIVVMIIVILITIFMHNLALAVLAGVVVASLNFTWNKSKRIYARTEKEGDTLVYKLDGPLFFGSTQSFAELFDPKNDPDKVIIDFKFTRVHDQSALEALNMIAKRYEDNNKNLHIRNLSHDCNSLLKKADRLMKINITPST